MQAVASGCSASTPKHHVHRRLIRRRLRAVSADEDTVRFATDHSTPIEVTLERGRDGTVERHQAALLKLGLADMQTVAGEVFAP